MNILEQIIADKRIEVAARKKIQSMEELQVQLPDLGARPDFVAALDRVLAACHDNGKAAGILTPTPELADKWIAKGYTFLVVGADGSLMARALTDLRGRFGS